MTINPSFRQYVVEYVPENVAGVSLAMAQETCMDIKEFKRFVNAGTVGVYNLDRKVIV